MIAQPEPYGVYVLRCENPDTVFEVEKRARRHIGMKPSWVYAALNCWEKYYVGMSGQVRRRLKHHITAAEEAANFTKVFPPTELVEVKWHRTRSAARQSEVQTAVEYRQRDADWFVYQE